MLLNSRCSQKRDGDPAKHDGGVVTADTEAFQSTAVARPHTGSGDRFFSTLISAASFTDFPQLAHQMERLLNPWDLSRVSIW